MSFKKIETFFNNNISKKPLSDLSLDKENNSSLINSKIQHFDYDEINGEIKTCDTLIFKNSKIIFVEFKKGNTIKNIDLRLKASESIISFINIIIKNQIVETFCFPTELFQLYFVYDRNNIKSTQVIELGRVQKLLQKEYRNIFSKYSIIPQDKFKKIFNI